MFLGKLATIDLVIIIAVPSAILLGAFIFFLAGLHHVPKNHAIVIEKVQQFYCVYDKGTHFKMPIAYQKVGTYCIVPQTRVYTAKNGNTLDVTYQIVDVEKYHYSQMTFEQLMDRIEKENSEISLTILSEYFDKYGLKFIGIKKSLI